MEFIMRESSINIPEKFKKELFDFFVKSSSYPFFYYERN